MTGAASPPPARSWASPVWSPVEYSSGDSVDRGHITKAGNAHLRTQLIESAWAYQHRPEPRGRPAPPAGRSRPGHRGPVLDRAATAVRPVPAAESRKNSRNIVAVAIARELAGFLWAEMTAALNHEDLSHEPAHGTPGRSGTVRALTHDASGHAVAGTIPVLHYGQPPRRSRPLLVRGTLLRTADMRSRHANIRQAAHRPAPLRRVVPTPPAHPHRIHLHRGVPAPLPDHPAPGRTPQGRPRASLRDRLRRPLTRPTRPRNSAAIKAGKTGPRPKTSTDRSSKPNPTQCRTHT